MSKTPGKHAAPKSGKIKKVLLCLLAVLLSIILAVVGTITVLYLQGRSSLLDRGEVSIITPESLPGMSTDTSSGSAEDETDTISYQGKTYRFNDNVVSILVMGIDKESLQEEGSTGVNGQADTLLLTTVDTVTGEIVVIPLSRDTMAEVDLYSTDGQLIGSEIMQLCLAYAYSDNNEDSCQNVCRSVSRLLYGVPIDSYIALDVEGVEVATDMLGGVPVTVLEDIAYKRRQVYLNKGDKVTLDGRKAIGYIRYRGKDVDANNRRMQRQKQFFTAFINKAATNLKKDTTKLLDYYSTIHPYVVSDLDISEITYLAGVSLLNRKQLSLEFGRIEGKSAMGKQYVEFYPDKQSVYEAVLQAFYTEVK